MKNRILQLVLLIVLYGTSSGQSIVDPNNIVVGANQLPSGASTDSVFYFHKATMSWRAGLFENGIAAPSISRKWNAAWGRNNNIAGDFSTGWGNVNNTSSLHGTVWGETNTVNGNFGTVWGKNNLVEQEYSTSWGLNNEVHAGYTTVWGRNNLVAGNDHTASGYANAVGGQYNNVWGVGNRANDTLSTCWGAENFAIGKGSTAWGGENRASARLSTVWGNKNVASENGATAWGFSNKAMHVASTVWGAFCQAEGQLTTSWGLYNTVDSTGSTAWGYSNKSLNEYATAWGSNNKVTGVNGTVMGEGNKSNGRNSTVIGEGNGTNSSNAFIVGQYNEFVDFDDPVNIGGGIVGMVSDNYHELFVVGNGDNDANRANAMVVTKAGRIGIGTSLPEAELHLEGSYAIQFGNSAQLKSSGSSISVRGSFLPLSTLYNLGSSSKKWGTIYANNGVIQTSDIRLKENILKLNQGLDIVNRLEPISYNLISDPSKREIGFSAQALEVIVPEVVEKDQYINEEGKEDHHYGVNYSELIPILTKAIQEQQQMIENLKREVDELKKKQ